MYVSKFIVQFAYTGSTLRLSLEGRLLVQLVYGLFACELLRGHMASCNDPSVQAKAQCDPSTSFPHPETGEPVARWWGNDDIGNFDSIGYAMLTLFEMATLEMWPDLLWRAMDTDPSGPDRGLTLNANAAVMARKAVELLHDVLNVRGEHLCWQLPRHPVCSFTHRSIGVLELLHDRGNL